MPKPFLLPLLAAGILTTTAGGGVVVTEPEVFDEMLHRLPGIEEGDRNRGDDDGRRQGGDDDDDGDGDDEESREEAERETERLFKNVRFTGGPNVVHAINKRDRRFELQGSADYVRAERDTVMPGNEAFAYSSCTDCQTLALALQLTVYEDGAGVVKPVNAALAINENCTRCLTIARAIQYVIPVPDIKAVPKEVRKLVEELDRELRRLENVDSLQGEEAQEVEARINSIITRFDGLRVYLEDKREVQSTGTPQTSVTPAQAGTPVPAPTSTPAAEAAPTQASP
jgi:hypothetical protein